MGMNNSFSKKPLVYLGIGNFFECFDFALYTHLAAILSPLFFPSFFNPDESLIFSFVTLMLFSLLATLIWGTVSDLKGRKVPLVWSCLCAGIGMILIPFIPDFLEPSISAAVLFCCLRGVVSFSLTGEYINTNIYITESYPQKRSPAYTAFIDGFACIGDLTSLGLATLCLKYLPSWGWKVCFFSGSFLLFAGFFFRRNLQESLSYSRLTTSKDQYLNSVQTIKEFLNGHTLNFYRFISIESLFGCGFVFIFIYCSKFLLQIGYKSDEILINSIFLIIIQMLACFLYGGLSLFFSPIMITKVRATILCFFLVGLLTYGFEQVVCNPSHLFIVQAICVLLMLDHIPSIPVLLKSFPIQLRSRVFNSSFLVGKSIVYILTLLLFDVLEKVAGFSGVVVLLILFSTLFIWGIFTFETYDELDSKLKIKYEY
jgi:MFS transporter, MHS family, proline/betaine transporter